METPFLKLGPKHWLSGISPSAHVPSSGVFYAAAGVTPLYDAGGSASVENGLLQAGASPTDFTTGVVDTIIGSVSANDAGSTPYIYFMGVNGHFYRKAVGSGAVSDLRSGTPITTPANGMEVWGPAGGTQYLWYWNNGGIGKWDMSGTYPSGWTDNVYSVTQATQHVPTHQFVGNVYYGGQNGKIGALLDAGSGTITSNTNVLDFPSSTYCTGIADDGTYLVLSVMTNVRGSNLFAVNKIYFWDTFSTSWTREFEIIDPFVWAVKNIGGVVYAFGQYGIWEVTLAGVKKVLNRSIDSISYTNYATGLLKKAIVYNSSALMFATTNSVDTFGKMSPDVPAAYLKPFKVPSGTPTHITASLDAGRVFVATDTPKLYAFDFNNATHDSGNTAQTVYFDLPAKMSIERIDVVFGEPLASGDAFSIGVYKDQDTAATDFGAATYAADGPVKRKSLRKGKITCEEQLSLLLTFTSGAVKVKYIEVFGTEMTP